MATVVFTPHLRQHVPVEPVQAEGRTVREVLDACFAREPRLRGYVLDDQGQLRRHVALFVDGQPIRDRAGLSDEIPPRATVFVLQALSGG